MTAGDYQSIKGLDNLRSLVDRKIQVRGCISDMPWQHIIAGFDDRPYSYYFDSAHNQTVIYTGKEITCSGEIVVFGTVIEVGSRSKKPGDDSQYREYQIRVDRVECAGERSIE